MTALVGLDTASWCPGGAERFRTPYADPGGTAARIVGWALEYVWPLHEWLDELVGDERAVAGFAASWEAAGRDLAVTSRSCADARRALGDMAGKTARALRRSLEELEQVARDAAEWTEAVAASLALASRVVTALHDSIAGALSELAAIIASLFDLASAFSDPLDYWRRIDRLADHVDRFVGELEGLVDAMLDALGELERLLRALVPLIEEAETAMRELASRILASSRLLATIGGALLGAERGVVFGPLGILVGSIVGGVTGGETAGILSDILASAPDVSELDPDDLSATQLDAYNRAMANGDLGSLTDLVVQNGHTDGMGTSDRTVVDVKLVEGADGTEHYVVSLPSTQDWNALRIVFGKDAEGFISDYPATNDLDTNIALMLYDHPELATQYQRGVYEAMRQAGVPAGADVVYTGFSQGGIMAGYLAADRETPYHPIATVTTGAPVDRFDIPDSVQVISFANDGDVVPRLDDIMDALPGSAFDQAHRESTIPVVNTTTEGAHSVGAYTASVKAWEKANPELARQMTELVGGRVVDHQTYTFGE